ncbi:MAG: hypothetical protein ABR600_06025 [Actinomycetota bacterium]
MIALVLIAVGITLTVAWGLSRALRARVLENELRTLDDREIDGSIVESFDAPSRIVTIAELDPVEPAEGMDRAS